MLALQRGLSLIELLIATAIGLFLTLGLFTMLSMSSQNVTATSQYNYIQENGRLALTLLEQDLSQLGFMGDMTGTELIVGQNTTLDAGLSIASGNECEAEGSGSNGFNNLSLPSTVNTMVHFRKLWGYEKGNSNTELSCIQNEISGSDVIQFKRVIGPSMTRDEASDNRIFLATTSSEAIFFDGAATAPFLANARYWEYQHRVYYIRRSQGTETLRRATLTNNGMTNDEHLVPGIENMQIQYGFDETGDNTADTFLNSEDVTDEMWDNVLHQRLVALRIYLLVRSQEEDPEYQNNIAYTLGSKVINGGGDHYRRKVVSTTIALENPLLINSN